MKKQFLIVALAGCLFGTAGCAIEGGYVETRPVDVVYSRPVSPGPDYIWIGGDWIWSGGRYAWHEGHWDRPRPGGRWEGGHWEQHNRGWKWHRGQWR